MKYKVLAVLTMFMVVAGAGVLLRTFHLFDQIPFGFIELRHAHSHLGFLGWVFPVAMLLIDHRFGQANKRNSTNLLFWPVMLVNVLMFGSFIFYGYDRPSIILLSIHTVLACVYGYKLLAALRTETGAETQRLIQASVLIMALSFIGPIAIPILKNSGGGPEEFKLAIHFYLHFQYNGFFVLSVLALMSSAGIKGKSVVAFLMLILGIVGTYFLTVSWYDGLNSLSWVGVVSAALQMIGGMILLKNFNLISRIRSSGPVEKMVLGTVVTALAIKWALQLTSNWITSLDVEEGIRMWTVAYLHLVFLGVATPYFFSELKNLGLIPVRGYSFSVTVLLGGLILTEVVLLIQGMGGRIFGYYLPANDLLILGSVGLFISATVLVVERLLIVNESDAKVDH